MISDGELLAACLSAGEPGTESHRLACRLYRRSVLEWQAGHAGWEAERARRAVLAGVARQVRLLAEAAGEAGLLGDCGTHGGYNRHCRERTLICRPCRAAEQEYRDQWYRALKATQDARAWQAAA